MHCNLGLEQKVSIPFLNAIVHSIQEYMGSRPNLGLSACGVCIFSLWSFYMKTCVCMHVCTRITCAGLWKHACVCVCMWRLILDRQPGHKQSIGSRIKWVVCVCLPLLALSCLLGSSGVSKTQRSKQHVQRSAEGDTELSKNPPHKTPSSVVC